MQLAARVLRQRVVGRVADQQVPEAEGVVAREDGAARPHELAAHEPLQARRHLGALLGRRELRDRVAPELVADDGCVLEEALLVKAERVEARGDECLYRLRHFEVQGDGRRV